MHGEGVLYRSYLRSNGVQLPTLLINPPPHRSAARSIVSRFHSQPHRRPSVRQRYLRGISPPAHYILHYRPRLFRISVGLYARKIIVRRPARHRAAENLGATFRSSPGFPFLGAEIAARIFAFSRNLPQYPLAISVPLISPAIFIAANQAAISGKPVAQSISTTCVPLSLIARLILKVRALATCWLQLDRTETAARARSARRICNSTWM